MDEVLREKVISKDVARKRPDLENQFLRLWDIEFSPNSQMLAAANEEKLTFWEAATGKRLLEIPAHDNLSEIKSIAFNRDGTLIATASSDGMVRLWGVPK
jgi:WD40 repeat protein